MSDFSIAYEPHGPNDLLIGRLLELALEKGFEWIETNGWPIADDLKLTTKDQILHFRSEVSEDVLFFVNNHALAKVRIQHGELRVVIVAASRQEAEAAMQAVKEQFPAEERVEDGKVAVTFWANTAQGPWSARRKIVVPTWEEIQGNYSAPVRESIAKMVNGFEPGKGGQLIIWDGSPGTGKTYALRAVAHAWKNWANVHYVSDADQFFDRAAYMFQVILTDHESHYGMNSESSDKWNLLILEDCGELLSADAKLRTGQGLTRLLNMVDGMIGQGLKLLVLITTNDPIKKFHEAVVRPGRMAQHISYEPLTFDEANEWLRQRGSNETVEKPKTLAELYSLVEGREPQKMERLAKVGFGS